MARLELGRLNSLGCRDRPGLAAALHEQSGAHGIQAWLLSVNLPVEGQEAFEGLLGSKLRPRPGHSH